MTPLRPLAAVASLLLASGCSAETQECLLGEAQTSCPDVKTKLAHGGWVPPTEGSVLDTETCTIERRHVSDLSGEEFLAGYWEQAPVIVEGFKSNVESAFASMCARDVLLEHYGTMPVILSSANKNSYVKKTVPLSEYLGDYMASPPVVQMGNTTWYHFGNNDHAAWPELFGCYAKPEGYMHDPKHFAYSFGIGASGTGVPFHTHGGVFNEVLYGRKRWWLKAPGREPPFHPDMSALQWTYTHYPQVANESREGIQECVIGPGEFIYVPGQWHHSTLNIGDTVFMATFL
eukprot:Rhum_TRINITY_DN9550_c0_g3::Rhum_TRINITY_DN9550_c0_g3_i1::g.34042::m.34042